MYGFQISRLQAPDGILIKEQPENNLTETAAWVTSVGVLPKGEEEYRLYKASVAESQKEFQDPFEKDKFISKYDSCAKEREGFALCKYTL